MTDKLDTIIAQNAIIIDKLNRVESNTADAKPDFAELGKTIGEVVALLVSATAQHSKSAEEVEAMRVEMLGTSSKWLASKKLGRFPDAGI